MQNNNSKKVWAILGAIIIIILIIVGISSNKKNKAKIIGSTEVNVGVVLGFTGDAAQDSEEMKRGIEMAKTDLEKEGYKVNINYQDDNTDPKKTVLAIQSMVSSSTKPDFIIGPAWSFLGSAASDIFTQNKLISYQPADTSEYVISSDYTYHLFGAPKLEKRGPLLNDFVQGKGFKKAIVITDKLPWGDTNVKVFTSVLNENNIEIIANERTPYGQDATIDTILAKYKDEKPDLIVWSGLEEGANILLKKYKQYGYTSTVVGDVLLQYRSAGELARQIGKVYPFKTQINKSFIDKYKTIYGTDPGNYSDSAYDGAMLLVKAFVEKNKNTDEVLKYLRSSSYKYKGFQTDYSFDERGDIISSTWKLEKVQ
jgi:branched-chain amino acid transport system substrate-binding protein